MDAPSVLAALRQRGATADVLGDQLRIRRLSTALSEPLRTTLRSLKAELRDLLVSECEAYYQTSVSEAERARVELDADLLTRIAEAWDIPDTAEIRKLCDELNALILPELRKHVDERITDEDDGDYDNRPGPKLASCPCGCGRLLPTGRNRHDHVPAERVVCAQCGQWSLIDVDGLCEPCRRSTERPEPPTCSRCMVGLAQYDSELCWSCAIKEKIGPPVPGRGSNGERIQIVTTIKTMGDRASGLKYNEGMRKVKR